jgi:carbon-monoxide dehydrogenase large subunit
MIVAGQLHGGVVQGIGQALMEKTVYDERRTAPHRLVHGLRDAARRRCAVIRSCRSPGAGKTNPLGVKGCGEAGCAGALTSVMNAVIDALADSGIRHLDMPLTPFRIWQALQGRKQTSE